MRAPCPALGSNCWWRARPRWRAASAALPRHAEGARPARRAACGSGSNPGPGGLRRDPNPSGSGPILELSFGSRAWLRMRSVSSIPGGSSPSPGSELHPQHYPLDLAPGFGRGQRPPSPVPVAESSPVRTSEGRRLSPMSYPGGPSPASIPMVCHYCPSLAAPVPYRRPSAGLSSVLYAHTQKGERKEAD
jgi:hypothetical protein